MNTKLGNTPCGKCGTKHLLTSCPAFRKKCAQCHKMNHFANVSRSKQINESEITIEEYSDTETIKFTGELKISAIDKGWYTRVNTSSTIINFKLDTGAEASIIPLKIYKDMGFNVARKTNVKLSTFSNHAIKSVGKATLSCNCLKGNTDMQMMEF